MQAYRAAFAKIYNLRWGGFARQAAPLLRAFYEAQGGLERSLLDLCCGAGHLGLHFLEHGYRVTGLDLSAPLLEAARENARPYLENGQAFYVQGDAAAFDLPEQFGLIASTFDALNHLPDFESLKSCFRCAARACAEKGWFIFDLNTRIGLLRWNGISVEDSPELMLVTRGIYDGTGERAWTHISGFLQTENGLYERFEETVYNTVFDMEAVQAALLEAGFKEAYPTRMQSLGTALDEPEKEGRVFFAARK